MGVKVETVEFIVSEYVASAGIKLEKNIEK